MRFIFFAERFRRKRNECRAQMFAVAIERVLRVRDDLRIKFVRLPDQTLVDRLQERLNVSHDLFPGTI
jgi:hypothetical protein